MRRFSHLIALVVVGVWTLLSLSQGSLAQSADDPATVSASQGPSAEVTTQPPPKRGLFGKVVGGIYRNTVGLPGNIANLVGTTIHDAGIDTKKYVKTPGVEQCASPLPVASGFAYAAFGPLTQMKHTWLKIDDGNGSTTFGMPFTDAGTYFGGDAHIYSPDPFVTDKPEVAAVAKCRQVYRPKEISEEDFRNRFRCVAQKLSIGDKNQKNWEAVFNYHATKSNCAMAAKFVVECAGGKLPLLVNVGVGEKYRPTDQVNKSEQVLWPHNPQVLAQVKEMVQKVSDEMFEAYDSTTKSVRTEKVKALMAFKEFLHRDHYRDVPKGVEPYEVLDYTRTYWSLDKWIDDTMMDAATPGRFASAQDLKDWFLRQYTVNGGQRFLAKTRQRVPVTLNDLCTQARNECNVTDHAENLFSAEANAASEAAERDAHVN